uniref:Putative secreted protein n=1 Tax=Anopheles marajoara TaxID=58244 RepID=A0A2M4CE54_9DIPT
MLLLLLSPLSFARHSFAIVYYILDFDLGFCLKCARRFASHTAVLLSISSFFHQSITSIDLMPITEALPLH